MIFRGHVRKGMIVLDEDIPLQEGAEVWVEMPSIAASVTPVTTSLPGAALMRFAGAVSGWPADASRNLKHYMYGFPKKVENEPRNF